MNMLNVIDKNLFLKKLYPNGLFNFYIGRIELNTFNPSLARACSSCLSYQELVAHHLGTPIMALDSEVNHVWNRQLDIYGRVKREFRASSLGEDVCPFIPFLYQGQYFAFETGLCYNRFRYYSPETGLYISQDPIGLAGNNPNLYAYVKDSNWWVDILGLRKYVVYQAYDLDEKGKRTGKIYTGRTSDDDDMSVDQILKRRHSNHHRNLEPLTSVYETDNYGAVRGG